MPSGPGDDENIFTRARFHLKCPHDNDAGGGTVYVPSHKNTSYNARNVAILNDYKAGKTPRQIAADYELSRNRVWEITKPVRDAQKEGGQGGL